MAAVGDEVLGAFMYPTCAPYSYPFPYPPAAKGADGWRLRGGGHPPASSSSAAGVASSSFPGHGQLTAAEYFDSYQRAQLLALLSHASPGFGPRPRRPSCRDVGVQVNPRRDASVQCALGRQTLPRRAREPGTPAAPARFPRSLAVYSPVVSRYLTACLEEAPGGAADPGPPEDHEGAARKASLPSRTGEERREEEDAGARPPSREAPAEEAAPQPTPRPPEQPPAVGSAGEGGAAAAAAAQERSPPGAEPAKERLRFQVRPGPRVETPLCPQRWPCGVRGRSQQLRRAGGLAGALHRASANTVQHGKANLQEGLAVPKDPVPFCLQIGQTP